MNRYQSNPINNRFDGKRVMTTTTYPPIPISSTDIYIIANAGDYLDSLALKYYSDTSYWWIIAQANGLKATLKAPVGMQLRIPLDVQSILSRFNSINSV
jgi:LysM repeat protein